MQNLKRFFSLLMLFLFLGSVSIAAYFAQENLMVKKPNYDIPSKIEIFLNGTTFEEINSGLKTTEYPNNTLEVTTNIGTDVYQNVTIRGRGNSSWTRDKKPYQISFSSPISLLGMPKEKKWVLLAGDFDNSDMRNDILRYMENMVGTDYAVDGRYVELYVDNEYVGLYYLMNKVEIEGNRVALSDPYGILVELENLHSNHVECYESIESDCLVISDAVDNDNADGSMHEFMTKFNDLLTAAKKGNYKKVEEVADVESMAKYFLIAEFSVNPDAYVSSMFMTMDGLDDKIHFGPNWDYDFAFGNLRWDWHYIADFHSPYESMVQRKSAFGETYLNLETNEYEVYEADQNVSKLFYYLMDIPEFEDEVCRVYRERMSGRAEELLDFVRRQAANIRDAALRDEELWLRGGIGVMGFDDEVEYLLDWIAKRYDFFEQTYGVRRAINVPQNML